MARQRTEVSQFSIQTMSHADSSSPVGWGKPNREFVKKMTTDPTTQEFIIDSNGTVTIRKYNHELKRSTSCDVWFDGVKVH